MPCTALNSSQSSNFYLQEALTGEGISSAKGKTLQEEMLSTQQDQPHPEGAHHRMLFTALSNKCTPALLIHAATTLQAAGSEQAEALCVSAVEASLHPPPAAKRPPLGQGVQETWGQGSVATLL